MNPVLPLEQFPSVNIPLQTEIVEFSFTFAMAETIAIDSYCYNTHH